MVCDAVLQIDALNPASVVLKEQQSKGKETKLLDALEVAVKVVTAYKKKIY